MCGGGKGAAGTKRSSSELCKLRCALSRMVIQRSIWDVTLDEDVAGLMSCLHGGVCVDERSDVGESLVMY